MTLPAPIAAYFDKQPPARRVILDRVRAMLLKALPDGEEVMSYGAPAVKAGGAVAVLYSVFKDHWGLFPTPSVIVELADELEHLDTSKGTIRFPLDKPIPSALVKKIAKVAEKHAAARVAARKPGKTAKKKAANKARAPRAAKKASPAPAKKKAKKARRK